MCWKKIRLLSESSESGKKSTGHPDGTGDEDILDQPVTDNPKGLRDKAMLELLYATGMRVSELVHLEAEDVNLRFGWIICREEGKERMIPFGGYCRTGIAGIYGSRKRFLYEKRAGKAAVFELFRSTYESSGILEGTQKLCGEGRELIKILHRECFVIPVQHIWRQAEQVFRLFRRCLAIQIWLQRRSMRNFSRE